MVAGMGCNIIPAFIEKHVYCQVFTKTGQFWVTEKVHTWVLEF